MPTTTLPPDTIAALARELYTARKTRTPVGHFSARHPGMTIDDGYAIQRAWVQLELADGRRIRGRSAAVQRQVGEALVAAARAHFGSRFDERALGLTLQIDEGHEVFDAKLSSIHPLFAGR